MKSWELRHVICHEVKFPALSSMGLGTALGAYFRAEWKQAIILFCDYNQQNRMQVAAKWSYLKQKKEKEKKKNKKNLFQKSNNLKVSSFCNIWLRMSTCGEAWEG